MQTMHAIICGVVHSLALPAPQDDVLPGIPWGRFDEILTPAYWRGQVWQHQHLGTYENPRLGRTLSEEVAACLLGGFGMKAELALAAFIRLRDLALLNEWASPQTLENALSEPFVINNELRRYRFPRQKSHYLAACLKQLADFAEPINDSAFRDHLMRLPGIGPKTASWIVRNYRASNSVAIIDVHILRAGRYINLFDLTLEPSSDYRELEDRFLRFAAALSVPPATLDSLMWDYMRRLPGRPITATPAAWMNCRSSPAA
jgi:thermostable 8-oxoguanine DNA glycosylase